VPELFIFNSAVIGNMPKQDHTNLTSILKNLHIPEGRPFIVNEDGMPDRHLDKFFDYLSGPARRSANTWKSYASQIILFIRFMEVQGKGWKEATKEDLNTYYMVRTSGDFQNTPPISGNSWNLAAAALIHLFEFAKDSGIINDVPFSYRRSKASLFRSTTNDIKTADLYTKFTPEQINFISIENYKQKWRPLLSNGLHAQRNLALTDLLISSGLRISEALNLKIHNIPDPDSQAYAGRKTVSIKVIGKGKKSRLVRIPKKIIRAIKFYIDEDRELISQRCKSKKKKASEYLFLANTGNRLSVRSAQSLFKKKSNKVEIRLTPHGCRHTFAIYQLEAMIKKMASNLIELKKSGSDAYRQLLNDPLRELQQLLGHSNISTTYIYLDFLEESEALVDESLADWTNWESENG
jgi:integrase/recombinase XerC